METKTLMAAVEGLSEAAKMATAAADSISTEAIPETQLNTLT